MTDIETFRRRARDKHQFAERVLADRRTRPWVRMMAERVLEQINFILSEDDPERVRDVSYYLAHDFSVMWGARPEAQRGEKLTEEKSTDKAKDAHRANAESRRQQVLVWAKVLLNDGHGRKKNGRINANALANECVKSGKRVCPLKFDATLSVIRQAIRDKKLQ